MPKNASIDELAGAIIGTYVKGLMEAPAVEDLSLEFEDVKDMLAEYLSGKGLRQLHTAETEKYAHVTFFFNGGREEPFPGEDRILVASPKVATLTS